MFYQPKFCCNCGEKIERVEWRLFTSRRFCDVCAIEHKGNELVPRFIVGLAILFGIFGTGSYFQSRNTDPNSGPINLEVPASKKNFAGESKRSPVTADTDSHGLEIGGNETRAAAVPKADSPVAAASNEQPAIRRTASDEPVYFCGAMTKKGKPCSRRVKSNERCWQHAGQPSAVPARKIADVF